MLFRILDNATGRIMGICFTEKDAEAFLSSLPVEEESEPDFKRYDYEDCFQNSKGHADQIGDTIAQLGRHIQDGAKYNHWDDDDYADEDKHMENRYTKKDLRK